MTSSVSEFKKFSDVQLPLLRIEDWVGNILTSIQFQAQEIMIPRDACGEV